MSQDETGDIPPTDQPPGGETNGSTDGEEDGYATQATRGMLWASLSSLFARGLGFVVTMVLTYLMGRGEYGEANTAFTMATTLGFFVVPGFLSELVRRKQRFAEAATLATTFSTAAWLTVAAVAFVFAGPLASSFNSSATYLRVALLIPTIVIPLLVPDALLNKQLRFGAQSLLEFGGSLSYVAVAVVMAATGFGGMAVLVGKLLRELLINIVRVALTGLGWLKRPRFDGPLLREMLAFGGPVWASNFLEHVAQNWDNLFVARVFGKEAVGAYDVAYTLAYTPVYTITQRVSGVVLATVTRFSDDAERRRDAIIRSLGAVMMLLSAGAVLTMFCGPRVVHLLIDKAWGPSVANLVMPLSLVAVGLPLQFLPDYYFQAIGRPVATVMVMLIKVVLMSIALLTFGRLSVESAAWSVSGSFVVAGLLACGMLRAVDEIPLTRVIITLLPAAIGGAVMGLTIWGLRELLPFQNNLLMLVIEIAAGSVAYLAYQLVFHRERVKDIISSLLG